MKKGLTFIGLLITLVIICLLLAFLLPQYTKTVQTQHKTQVNALQQARQLQQQLNAQQRSRQQFIDRAGELPSRPPKRQK